MRKIKVAVIGVGHLGSIHARIYRHMPEAKLVAISDINHSRLKEASRQLGVPGFADYKQLFGKIDAVSIATPTRLHYKVGRDCLREKISALIEKPFTSNLTQADELIKLAKKNKLTLQVGHIERFNSAFVATRKLIKNPRFIECHRLSPFPYRSLDVGVVLDLMIHDIDIVLGLVKSKIRKIDAVGINVLTPFEDIASARLEFSNGCVCNLTSSRISDDVMRKIRIFLADSYISLDYKNEDAFVYKRNKRGISKKPLPIEREPSLRKELADFLKCVKNKSKPIVCGEAARQALAVAIEINNKIWRRKN
ncbi:MAG: Gfo/Idh/MocA family oxidoreductase [Candidatus Omnitrophica bacterium]|nr:Gfo/Idh/MocA family oxidoreductase [Candidatus Omnitrophota bacterium]